MRTPFRVPAPYHLVLLLYLVALHIPSTAFYPRPSRLISKYPLRAVFDVNARDCKGETELIISAERGETAKLQALLQLGADVNACSQSCWTALHGAAEVGNLGCVEILVASGARVDARANNGLTPRGIALKYGNKDVAAVLQRLEQNVNASDAFRIINSYGSKTRRPTAIQATMERTGFKYWCDDCGVGFKKKKNWEQHRAGKKHAKVVAEKASSWDHFVTSAPTWATNNESSSSLSSPLVSSETALSIDVATAWSVLDDLDKFPTRHSGMLDPSATVASISPAQRGRFYRYLIDNFGVHYPELPSIFHHVDASGCGRFLRVKELFESLEAFKVLSSVVLTSQSQQRSQEKEASEPPESASSSSSFSSRSTIWDLACGHGLVGILLAYRFPKQRVVCVDLERRPAFDAFVAAWDAHGDVYNGDMGPLDNLFYVEGDLKHAFTGISLVSGSAPSGSRGSQKEAEEGRGRDGEKGRDLTLRRSPGRAAPQAATLDFVRRGDCVVALHACNQANVDVVRGARHAGAVWAVMPCCIAAAVSRIATSHYSKEAKIDSNTEQPSIQSPSSEHSQQTETQIGSPYLGACSVELNDDARYLVLTGAFAQAHEAQLVRSLDKRITARNIILAGGLPTSTSPAMQLQLRRRATNMPSVPATPEPEGSFMQEQEGREPKKIHSGAGLRMPI